MKKFRIIETSIINGLGKTQNKYSIQKRGFFKWYDYPIKCTNHVNSLNKAYFKDEILYFYDYKTCLALCDALRSFEDFKYKNVIIQVGYNITHDSALYLKKEKSPMNYTSHDVFKTSQEIMDWIDIQYKTIKKRVVKELV